MLDMACTLLFLKFACGAVSCSLGCLWGVSGLGVLLYSCDAHLLILICCFNHIYQTFSNIFRSVFLKGEIEHICLIPRVL